jgi:1-deoxy-D-xylulose-5-phosphate synthase
MADNNYNAEIVRLGIPDEFINHGTQEELRNECGYDKQAIVSAVEKLTVRGKVPQAI